MKSILPGAGSFALRFYLIHNNSDLLRISLKKHLHYVVALDGSQTNVDQVFYYPRCSALY